MAALFVLRGPLDRVRVSRKNKALAKSSLAGFFSYLIIVMSLGSLCIWEDWGTSGAAFMKCPETSTAARYRNIIILCSFPLLAAGIAGPKLINFSPIGMEWIMIIFCACLALGAEFQNPSYMLIMTGADPQKYMGGFGDNKEKSVLLILCIIAQVSHIAVPTRWIML